MRTFTTVFFSLLIFTTVTGISAGSIAEETSVFGKCWDHQVVPDLGSAPVVDSSNVYFLDNENKLQSLDLALGNKSWSSELGGQVVSNLLVADGSIFVVTNSPSGVSKVDGKAFLRSISRGTGITEWQAEIASSPVVWLGSVAGKIVTVASDGSISALTPAEGRVAWKVDLKIGVASKPVFGEGGIVLGTMKNEIVKVSGIDGRIQKVWTSKRLPTAVLIDAAGRLVVGDERGNVTSISSSGNRLWGFKNGAQISSTLLHGSEYIAVSFDNFVYKLSRSGNVKWKRRLSGRVGDGPLILGDTAVISIVGAGSVYVLDLRNGKISNRIEMGDELSLRVAAANDRGFVVSGPQGLSYFTSSKCPAKEKDGAVAPS